MRIQGVLRRVFFEKGMEFQAWNAFPPHTHQINSLFSFPSQYTGATPSGSFSPPKL